MQIILSILLSLFISSACLAEPGVWKVQEGNITGSTSPQSVKGINAWMLITPDTDWREKWDTPENVIPHFNETDTVRLGEKVTILTFYTNPGVDEKNFINLLCDVAIKRPDETISFEQEDMICAREQLSGNPTNVRLTYAIIDFVGEIGDPFGIWSVTILLKDQNSGIWIPLHKQFELIHTGTMAHTNSQQKWSL